MFRPRVPPDVVASAGVRPRECQADHGSTASLHLATPLKLSRPQKRRRRMQLLAGHRAVADKLRHPGCAETGAVNAGLCEAPMCNAPLPWAEAALVRLETKIDSLFAAISYPWYSLPTDSVMGVGDDANMSEGNVSHCLRPDAVPFFPEAVLSAQVWGACQPAAETLLTDGPPEALAFTCRSSAAAVRIQSVFRGHRVREALRSNMSEDSGEDRCGCDEDIVGKWEYLASTLSLTECKLSLPTFKRKFRPAMSMQEFLKSGIEDVRDYDVGVWFKLQKVSSANTAHEKSVSNKHTASVYSKGGAKLWDPEKTFKYYKFIVAKYRDDEALSPAEAVLNIAEAMKEVECRIVPEVYAIIVEQLDELRKASDKMK